MVVPSSCSTPPRSLDEQCPLIICFQSSGPMLIHDVKWRFVRYFLRLPYLFCSPCWLRWRSCQFESFTPRLGTQNMIVSQRSRPPHSFICICMVSTHLERLHFYRSHALRQEKDVSSVLSRSSCCFIWHDDFVFASTSSTNLWPCDSMSILTSGSIWVPQVGVWSWSNSSFHTHVVQSMFCHANLLSPRPAQDDPHVFCFLVSHQRMETHDILFMNMM